MTKIWKCHSLFCLAVIMGLAACSGSSNQNSPNTGNTTPSGTGSTLQNPPSSSTVTANTDDTNARLEALALKTGVPKETVLETWKKFSEDQAIQSLNDLDVTKEESLLLIYHKLMGRVDPALRFVGRKIFSDDEDMISRFREYYKKLSEDSFATQDEFDSKFGDFRRNLDDLRYATAIFARQMLEDLNILFPGRFSMNYGLTQCNNAACEGFVSRSMAFLDGRPNAERFKNYVDHSKTGRKIMEEFFTAFFNNTLLTVGDKQFVFVRSDVGLESLKPDYTMKDSD